jgi:predicted secreted protein
MNVVTAVVLYVLIWWTSLFVVLPFGVKPSAEADPHSGWRGTPERPRILLKLVATTILATVVFGICFFVIQSGWISFRVGPLALPND